MLVEFPSVVNAVACAAEVQRAMRDRNAAVPRVRRIEFRIGVSLGDVMVEGDDIYGDGVNIAVRLERFSKPGGIAISQTVRDHVGNRLDLAFEDCGEQKLKNIEKPVRVYSISLGTTLAGTTTGAAMKREERPQERRPAVAVLPFTNMSGDAEQEYFSDA
jgi:adenylate cyclase